MNKKIGSLKAWQWAAIIGGMALAYYLYKRYQANQTTTTMDTSNAATPTSGSSYAGGGSYTGYGGGLASQLAADFIDPTTNQPYFQEFSNAMSQQSTDFSSAISAIANSETLTQQQLSDTSNQITSTNTQIESQLSTLTSTIQALASTTPTVPTPRPPQAIPAPAPYIITVAPVINYPAPPPPPAAAPPSPPKKPAPQIFNAEGRGPSNTPNISLNALFE